MIGIWTWCNTRAHSSANTIAAPLASQQATLLLPSSSQAVSHTAERAADAQAETLCYMLFVLYTGTQWAVTTTAHSISIPTLLMLTQSAASCPSSSLRDVLNSVLDISERIVGVRRGRRSGRCGGGDGQPPAKARGRQLAARHRCRTQLVHLAPFGRRLGALRGSWSYGQFHIPHLHVSTRDAPRERRSRLCRRLPSALRWVGSNALMELGWFLWRVSALVQFAKLMVKLKRGTAPARRRRERRTRK
jgi:hypothetical protein